MIAEFCTWCREYLVNKNLECRECESCLKCQHFDKECCTNEAVLSEFRKEWNMRKHVFGIVPPICRAYCPYLSADARYRAYVLSQGESPQGSREIDTHKKDHTGKEGKHHTILYTPIPKFWLTNDCECITFEIEFSETIHYHLVLLGKCVWDIPEEIILEIPNDEDC